MPLSDFPPRTIATMAGNDARKAVDELKRKRRAATTTEQSKAADEALRIIASTLADIIKEIS